MRGKQLSLILFLLCLVYGGLNLYNGRFEMRDLQVYYDAAAELLEAGTPYGQAFGLSSGFYKYSPAAALFFAPFHLLGWMATRVIYFIALAFSIAWGLPWIVRTFANRNSIAALIPLVLLSVLAVGGHLSREMLLGNVNWFLLLLAVIAFRLLKERATLGGVVIGLILLFKPHFAVLLPWLVLRQEWKPLATSAGTILVGLFLPAIGLGWTSNLELIAEWGGAILAHNGELGSSPNTVFGLISNTTGSTWSGWVLSSIALTGAAVFGWMLYHFKKEKEGGVDLVDRFRRNEYFLLIAIIPNLVHTDTEHFMWVLPLIIMWLTRIWKPTNVKGWVKFAVWGLAVIPFTLTTPDIWGQEMAEWFDKSGVLGIANLVFIALFLIEEYPIKDS